MPESPHVVDIRESGTSTDCLNLIPIALVDAHKFMNGGFIDIPASKMEQGLLSLCETSSQGSFHPLIAPDSIAEHDNEPFHSVMRNVQTVATA